MAAKNSPVADVRVRQALNYCIDRNAIVTLLNGTAEPSVGWLKADDPAFGNPENRYTFDPAKGKKLLAEAGYTDKKPLSFKVMISTSGSGQMLPLPMNEALQENLKQACGVDVQVEAVEWQVLLNASRAVPDDPTLKGAMGAQCQLAVERRRHDVPLLRGGQLLADRLQFGAMEGRQVRGGVQDALRGDRRRHDPEVLHRSRTSAWSTIRRGSTSCTTSTRAPSARR